MSILKDIKSISISENTILAYSFVLFEMKQEIKETSKLRRNLQRMFYISSNNGCLMNASYWRGDYYNLLISEREKLNSIRRERDFLNNTISINTNQKRGRL